VKPFAFGIPAGAERVSGEQVLDVEVARRKLLIGASRVLLEVGDRGQGGGQ
jgi:hypothetical protein